MVLRCDGVLRNDDHIVWPPVQGQLGKPSGLSGSLVTEISQVFAYSPEWSHRRAV